MSLRGQLSFLMLLCCLKGYAQTTLYVDSSISVSGTGTSWVNAYKTLTEALNNANAGSAGLKYQINIARGTYYPTGIQNGTNRDSAFQILRANISFVGGYPSGGGVINSNANPTILSGEIGSSVSRVDNSYHVLVISNLSGTDTIALNGLMIQSGVANGTGNYTYAGTAVNKGWGAGMYVGSNVSAKLIFRDCTFTANSADRAGGGLANLGSEMNISACSFNANTSPNPNGTGGAIYLSANRAVITGSSFSSNSAGTSTANSSGGAIYLSNIGAAGSGVTIDNDTFSVDSAAYGGAIFIASNLFAGGYTTVRYCLFMNNRGAHGGAIGTFLNCDGSTYFRNTFIGNSAASEGGAIGNQRTITFPRGAGTGDKIDSCTFIANTATGPTGFGGAVSEQGNDSTNRILGCTFVSNSAPKGGGAYVFGITTLIRGCFFSGNSATSLGGGLYYSPVAASNARIDSTTFDHNHAGSGGGLYGVYSAPCIVSYCRFNADTALSLGGAMYSRGSVEHSYCQYAKNQANQGGAIYVDAAGNSLTVLHHSTLQGNTALSNGGGMFVNASGTYYSMNNLLISGNKAFNKGGAIFDSICNYSISYSTIAGDTGLTAGNGIYHYSASPGIANCIVWDGSAGIVNAAGSSPAISYSIIGGGYPGNLSYDPHFVNGLAAALAPAILGNYALTACSPAINAGSSISVPGLDLAGNPRTFDGRVDIGAYEYQGGAPLTGPSAICNGTTAQFSSSTSGGTWSLTNTALGSINSGTGVLTATAPGVDTVLYTVFSGACAGVTRRVVTINASPVVGTTTGPATICSGTTSQFSNSVPGGAWSLSNLGLGFIYSSTGMLTATAPGVDTVIYTVYLGTCAATTRSIITINSSPVVGSITNSGSDSLCAGGGSITLNNPTAGGVWTHTNSSLTNITTGGVVTGNPANTGGGLDTISYTVTNPTTGCSTAVSRVIRILPKPSLSAITGPSFVCIKDGTFTLLQSATGGAWHALTPAIATISGTGLVTPLAVGMADFSYYTTTANGCADSVTYSLVIGGVDNSVTQTGSTLTANLAGASSYQWLNCNSGYAVIAGQTGQSFTATANGSYAVRIVGIGGCADTSGCYTVSGVGIASTRAPAITIFPNPASDRLMMQSTGPLQNTSAFLCDIAGRPLINMLLDKQTTVINLENYPPGVYLLVIRDGINSSTQRVTIAR